MKETKTTTTALVIINTKLNRIAAAHARHIVKTPEIIRMTETTRDIWTTANTAAYIAIHARHSSAGDLPILRQLQDNAGNDPAWNTLPDLAAQALDSRARHAALVAHADKLQSIINRVSTDTDTRAAATAQLHHIKSLAEQERNNYQTIERRAEQLTASDRADIVQSAALAIIEQAHTDGIADMGTACHAAGAAIAQTASPDALTSSRTRRTEITPAQAKALEARQEVRTSADGHIREYVTKSGVKGYTTIARKDGKIYRVDHESTIAPYISYEEFAAGESADALKTNGGINAITGQTEAETINAFLIRAKLTDIEQKIVRAAADNTAAAAGQRAKNQYIDTHTPTDVKRITNSRWERIIAAADNAGQAARWDNAFVRCRIYSKSNQTTIKSRIRKKLEKALANPEPMTAAERDEKTAKKWERMQRNSSRGRTPSDSKRPDMIAAVTRATAGRNAHHVITWIDHNTAERNAHRQPKEPTKIDNTTPAAQAAAKAAADRYTRKQAQAAAEQERRQAQAQADSVTARAHDLGVDTLNTTFAQWQAWTDTQRAAHRAWLDVLALA